MTTPSEVARRIAGTFVEDDASPKPALWAWIQAECRTGCFREALETAIKGESEPMRVELTLVEKIDPDKITVRIPCRVADHESTSTFEMDVRFELNPLSLCAKRV